MKHAHQHFSESFPEYIHFQRTTTVKMSVNLEDIPNGLSVAISWYVDSPRLMVITIWLLIDSFTIVIRDMDFALHVDYSEPERWRIPLQFPACDTNMRHRIFQIST